MEFSNFIVIGDQIRKKGAQTVTVSGTVFIALDVPVPVIIEGEGCIGLGIVKELRIRSSSTDICFELTRDISVKEKEFLYNLYRNQISMGGSSNGNRYAHSSKDVIIPGAIGSIGGNSSRKRSSYMDDTDIPYRRGSKYDDIDYGYGDDLSDDRAW